MRNGQKVENFSELYRDSQTGAIINTSTTELKMYLAQREKIALEKIENEKIRNELNTLKTEFQQLRDMVSSLINKD